MSKDSDKAAKAYQRWRSAEARYAELITPLQDDLEPPNVSRGWALDLAAARSRADLARDRYFKLVLRS